MAVMYLWMLDLKSEGGVSHGCMSLRALSTGFVTRDADVARQPKEANVKVLRVNLKSLRTTNIPVTTFSL